MNTDLEIQTAEPSYVQIERHFRHQLQLGALKSGERLPTNAQLAKRFRVSPRVVQKAMAQLTADGLLERARKRGTFVKQPTEKAVIGVLFGPSLTDETAYFYRGVQKAIREEADAFDTAQLDCSCRFYDGLTDDQGLPASPNAHVCRQLASDLRNHAFKGVIEFSPGTKSTPLIEPYAAVPRVRYESPPATTDVQLDLYRFGFESVAHLARVGRRRIAYVRFHMPHEQLTADLDGVLDAAREFGLVTPRIEELVLPVKISRMEREAHRHLLEFIRSWPAAGPNSDRPDGLVVSEDVVMRSVALALLQLGVQVPQELQVVSLAHDAVEHHYGLPVVRYEFSTREIARALLQLLWKRMVGEAEPQLPILVRGQIKEENS